MRKSKQCPFPFSLSIKNAWTWLLKLLMYQKVPKPSNTMRGKKFTNTVNLYRQCTYKSVKLNFVLLPINFSGENSLSCPFPVVNLEHYLWVDFYSVSRNTINNAGTGLCFLYIYDLLKTLQDFCRHRCHHQVTKEQ